MESQEGGGEEAPGVCAVGAGCGLKCFDVLWRLRGEKTRRSMDPLRVGVQATGTVIVSPPASTSKALMLEQLSSGRRARGVKAGMWRRRAAVSAAVSARTGNASPPAATSARKTTAALGGGVCGASHLSSRSMSYDPSVFCLVLVVTSATVIRLPARWAN